jgi:hypothetical protein
VPATISEKDDVVRVKCFKCQRAQDVPAEQQSFVCEQCG